MREGRYGSHPAGLLLEAKDAHAGAGGRPGDKAEDWKERKISHGTASTRISDGFLKFQAFV